jgi:hypothetical protein
MPDEKRGADSLRFYLTGAQTIEGAQGNPDLSLGAFASKDRMPSFGVERITAIGDVKIWHVAGENGMGTGILEAISANELTWTPPGGTTGTAVTIADREFKSIAGADASKYVVVERLNATALAGTETVKLSEMVNNVVGFDNVTSAEALAGDTEYRALMMRNVSDEDLDNIKIWHGSVAPFGLTSVSWLPAGANPGTIEGPAGRFATWPLTGYAAVVAIPSTIREAVYYASRTDDVLTVAASGRARLATVATAGSSLDSVFAIPGYRIAKEAPTANAITDKTVAGEGSQPGGLSWLVTTAAANALSIGTLTPGQRFGLWFEREIGAATIAEALVDVRFDFSFSDQTPTSFSGSMRGKHRIANDALRGWLIYRGNGQLPDFDAAAFHFESVAVGETAATFSTPALPTGQESHLVPRFRNEHGAIQLNFEETIIDVAASGAENRAKPSAPQAIEVTAAENGAISVTALYNPLEDGENFADTWAIWINTDGTAPDPDVDAVTETVAMADQANLEVLDFTSAAVFTDGAPGSVVVRTRRNLAVPLDSANTDVVAVTVNAVAPTKPRGVITIESAAAQRQVPATPPSSPTDDFVVDAGNNIRFEPGEGRSFFYGDTVLIWAAIMHAEDDADNYVYFPDGWDFNQVDPVGAGGSSDPIEVISWTGPDKRLGVNVNGVREMLIDVTNLEIRYQSRNEVDDIDSIAAPIQVWPQFAKTRFQIWDPGLEDWRTYMSVDSAGEWRLDIWRDETLTQAAIEAL